MGRYRFPVAAALLTALVSVACEDATTVDLLEVEATGVVSGLAYLDNDGDALPGAADDPLEGVRVLLTSGRNGAVVLEATTGASGAFRMRDVPLGSYELTLDEATLGDSLLPVGGEAVQLQIERGDTLNVDFGASFPVLPLDEVRAQPPGRRVFTSGIALNARLSFGDGVVHLAADSAWLRATNVARAGIAAGDSVRFLGRTARDAGQTVLKDVTPFVLVQQAAIAFPVEVGTGEAANAREGALDAALVRVRQAAISDTGTVDGAFRFMVDDGSGSLEVLLRPFLQIDPALVQPDTLVGIGDLTGLLVPVPEGPGWRLLPRSGQDISVEVDQGEPPSEVSGDPSAGSQRR